MGLIDGEFRGATKEHVQTKPRSFWERAREAGDRILILLLVALALFMAAAVSQSVNVLSHYPRNDVITSLLILGMILEAACCAGAIIYLLHIKEEIDEMD